MAFPPIILPNALISTARTTLNRSGEDEHVSLAPFSIKDDVHCLFSLMPSIRLRNSFLFLVVEYFGHEGELNVVKCFFWVYWNDHGGFVLYSIDMVYYIN